MLIIIISFLHKNRGRLLIITLNLILTILVLSLRFIDDAQHGFRKGRPCETQLILTVHDIAEGLNNKGQTDIILLDFAKAFDSISFSFIEKVLVYFGFGVNMIGMIRTLLYNFQGPCWSLFSQA